MWGGWSIIVTIKLDTLGGTFRAIVALKYDFYVVEYDKILVWFGFGLNKKLNSM